MSQFLELLENIYNDLESEKAKVAQALGNTKYAVEKIFSRKKRREDKHASRWDALHEYYRSQKDEWGVNMMNIFKNFSRTAGDPDPAHYFNQLLTLVRDSDDGQKQNMESSFWIYYGKRYHPEWGNPEELYNPYNKPEEELINNFVNAVKVAQEALQIKVAQAAEAREKEAEEAKVAIDPAVDLVANLSQNPILYQQVLDLMQQQQLAEAAPVPPLPDYDDHHEHADRKVSYPGSSGP